MAGVVGGAIVPPLTGAAADAHGTPLAMVVPLMFFVAALSYALAVNFVPAYRDPADAFSTTEVGLRGHQDDVETAGSGVVGDDTAAEKRLEAEHVK